MKKDERTFDEAPQWDVEFKSTPGLNDEAIDWNLLKNKPGDYTNFIDVSAAYSIDKYTYVRANATGAPFTVTLPLSKGVVGLQTYVVKRVNTGANAVTIACSGGQTIDGSATLVLGSLASATIVSTASGWDII